MLVYLTKRCLCSKIKLTDLKFTNARKDGRKGGMFGSSKYQSQAQSDPAAFQAANPLHASLGVSENQIEEVATDSAPAGSPPQPHAIASAPTAPPLADAPEDSPANANTALDINSTGTEDKSDDVLPDAAKSMEAAGPEPPSPAKDMADSDLLDIKKSALQSLAPLVDKLDQTPEEKFKTTMMLIQASDNAQLVKEAYEAANSITDEKSRAQALLDVVNEINYFTQQSKDSNSN